MRFLRMPGNVIGRAVRRAVAAVGCCTSLWKDSVKWDDDCPWNECCAPEWPSNELWSNECLWPN